MVAVGRPELVKGSWVKPGAIVLDIGINPLPLNPAEGDSAAPRPGDEGSRPPPWLQDGDYR